MISLSHMETVTGCQHCIKEEGSYDDNMLIKKGNLLGEVWEITMQCQDMPSF